MLERVGANFSREHKGASADDQSMWQARRQLKNVDAYLKQHRNIDTTRTEVIARAKHRDHGFDSVLVMDKKTALDAAVISGQETPRDGRKQKMVVVAKGARTQLRAIMASRPHDFFYPANEDDDDGEEHRRLGRSAGLDDANMAQIRHEMAMFDLVDAEAGGDGDYEDDLKA